MNFKNEINKLLIDLKNRGISRKIIEKDLNYSENYITQQLSRGGNEKLYEAIKNYKSNIAFYTEKRSHEGGQTDVSDLKETNRVLLQMQLEHAQAINRQADANRMQAEVNKNLTEELRLKNPTASEILETLRAFDARLFALRVLTFQVGQGRRFESEDEALSEMGRLVAKRIQDDDQQEGTQTDGGNGRK